MTTNDLSFESLVPFLPISSLVRELAYHGIKVPKDTDADILVAAFHAVIAARLDTSPNLDTWTCIYLDTHEGKGTNDELQAFLRTIAPTCSPKAASNRKSMQRKPAKYGVKPGNVTRYAVASSRGGAVQMVATLSDKKSGALAALLASLTGK